MLSFAGLLQMPSFTASHFLDPSTLFEYSLAQAPNQHQQSLLATSCFHLRDLVMMHYIGVGVGFQYDITVSVDWAWIQWYLFIMLLTHEIPIRKM